ncbi:MAG: prepilin-type N-terminal cleavage/methylation domain-containing protein [Pedosphaera sp.]|nr:prepilin-type N-terminal cleavage/methylation domain-containing protein [Pedosphaera sp.]
MHVRSDRYRSPRTVQALAGQTSRAGFTLIELLLAVVLMLLLLGAAVFNFSSLQRNVGLDEGCVQIEALLRFARAHAIGTGRTVQLLFPEIGEETTPGTHSLIQLLTEADPVANPGLYSIVQEAVTYTREIESRVKIVAVRDISSDDQAPVAAAVKPTSFHDSSVPEPAVLGKVESGGTESSDGNTIPERLDRSVFFFADGTSDAVEIVVASREHEDPRKRIIELVGVTGTPRRRGEVLSEEIPHGSTETANPARAPDKERRP